MLDLKRTKRSLLTKGSLLNKIIGEFESQNPEDIRRKLKISYYPASFGNAGWVLVIVVNDSIGERADWEEYHDDVKDAMENRIPEIAKHEALYRKDLRYSVGLLKHWEVGLAIYTITVNQK